MTKTKDVLLGGGSNAGRFDMSLPRLSPLLKEYRDLFNSEAYLNALPEWEAIAHTAGCSKAELAYRWVKFNSPLSADRGDGMIVGAGSSAQLTQTLKGFENGPLEENVCEAVDKIWKSLEHGAPLDCFNG